MKDSRSIYLYLDLTGKRSSLETQTSLNMTALLLI